MLQFHGFSSFSFNSLNVAMMISRVTKADKWDPEWKTETWRRWMSKWRRFPWESRTFWTSLSFFYQFRINVPTRNEPDEKIWNAFIKHFVKRDQMKTLLCFHFIHLRLYSFIVQDWKVQYLKTSINLHTIKLDPNIKSLYLLLFSFKNEETFWKRLSFIEVFFTGKSKLVSALVWQ